MNLHSGERYDDQGHSAAPTRHITGRPRREAQIDALIGAMVQGLGVAEAAEAASMARSTAYELLQLPEVQDRQRQARGEALAAAARPAGEPAPCAG